MGVIILPSGQMTLIDIIEADMVGAANQNMVGKRFFSGHREWNFTIMVMMSRR